MISLANERVKPLIALGLMTILWGCGWTVLKIGLIDAEPFKFTALRMSLSAIFLLLVLAFSGRPFLPTRVPELIILGIIQTSLLFTLSTCAVDQGSSGRVAFLVYTMPFFTLILARLLLAERIRGLQWIAIFLAFLGLLAILEPWKQSLTSDGGFLGVAAGAVWAISVIMVKKIQDKEPIDMISMTAWQMTFGSVPLIFFVSFVDENPITWSIRFILVLAFIAIVITGLGWLLWVYALERLEAGSASLITLATPVVAISTSTLLLNENPNNTEIAGMTLITAALLFLVVHANRDADP